MSAYGAILYDLDGVIRTWDPADLGAIEAGHGLPPGSILAAAFEPSLVARAVCGEIDDAAWRKAVRAALAEHGAAADAAVSAWTALTGRVVSEMVELVAAMRPRLRTGLITNATTRVEADLRLLRLDGCFDAVISSARVGVAKPDARIFHLAAERLGHRPEECIFVDDTPGHVEGARAIGLTGILFAGAADLRARLDALLAE